MKTHSPIGASSAYRWMNCPGSVELTRDLPEQDTEYALEGTAAHMLAELKLLAGDDVNDIDNLLVPTKEGATTMIPVTREMHEAVGVYVQHVRSLVERYGGQMLVEYRITLALANPPEPGMWGTADCVILPPRWIHVVDLKYGTGVLVEVRDNPQLLYYAFGVWLTLGRPDIDGVTIHVVQPRAEHPDGPVRSITYTPGQLHVFGLDLLRAAWRAVENKGQTLVPGKWCRFCPAQGHCPALMKTSQELAQVEFADMPLDRPPSPETLPLDVAADILTKAPILEAWLDALRARITHELEAGRPVPGWKLVAKRAVRKWAVDEREVVKTLWEAGLLVPEMAYDTTLKSPAQMEKVVGKNKLPPELVEKVSSGTTLAPASDVRPEAAVGPALDFPALPSGRAENP